MSYHTLIRTEPKSLYILEEAPFQDLSRTRLSNLSSSTVVHPLGVYNVGKPIVTAPKVGVPTGIDGAKQWTVAVVTKVISDSGDIFIMGGVTLKYQGGRLVLSMSDGSTQVESSVALDFKKVMHIVCTKDYEALILYADGAQVINVSLPQELSSYPAGTNLSLGGTTGTSVAVANPMVLDRVIADTEVAMIQADYSRYPYRKELSDSRAVSAYTPELLSVRHQVSLPSVQSEGSLDSSIPGHFMSGIDETGLSVDSEIRFSYLAQSGTGGVAVYWDASYGVTVERTLDSGDTWTDVRNGWPLFDVSLLEAGDVDIGVRVAFTPGLADRPFISGLRVVDFDDREVSGITVSNRFAHMTGDVYIPPTAHRLQLHGDGIRFGTGGALTIGPDENEFPENISSVEVSFSIEQSDTSGTKTVMNSSPESITVVGGSINYSGLSNVHINGLPAASGSVTMRPGLTYHLSGNFTTPHNKPIVFGSSSGASIDGPVGTIVLNTSTLTAQQAKDVFHSYLKYPTEKVINSGAFYINDEEMSHYMTDWSVIGS